MNVTRGGDWEEEQHHRVYRTHAGSSFVGWAVGRRFGHDHNIRQPTKTFTTLDVRLDGMLWKQGSWRKNWKQRFFILRRDALRLSYYDSAKSLNLLGEVFLVDATRGQGAPRLAVLSPVGEDDGPGMVGFSVRCAATGRELRLRSATIYDRDKWLRAIRSAMQHGLREISKVDDDPKASTLADQQDHYAEGPQWDVPALPIFASHQGAELRSTSRTIGTDALGLHITVHLTHAAYDAQDGMFVVLFVQASPLEPHDGPASPTKGHRAEPAGLNSSPCENQVSAKARSFVRINKHMINRPLRQDVSQAEHVEEARCYTREHEIEAYLGDRPCEEEADDVALEEDTDDEVDEPKSSHEAISPLSELNDDLRFPDDNDEDDICRSRDSAPPKSPLVHGRLNAFAKHIGARGAASPRGGSMPIFAARGAVVSSNNKRWRELARTEVVRAGDSGAFACQVDRRIEIVRQFTVLLPSPGRWKGKCALIAVYRRLNDADALRRQSRIMWVELDAPAIAKLADQPCSRIVELNLVDKFEEANSENNAARAVAAAAAAASLNTGTIPASKGAELSSTIPVPATHMPSKKSNFHLCRQQIGNAKRLNPMQAATSTNENYSSKQASNSPEETVEQLPNEGRLLIVGVEAAGIAPCAGHFYARQHYQFRSLVDSAPDTGRKSETCYSYVLVSEALGAPQCAVALPAALLELVVAERRTLALDIIERVQEAATEKRALAEELKAKSKEAALAVTEKIQACAEAQAFVTAACPQAQDGGIRDDTATLTSQSGQSLKQLHNDMTTFTKRLKLARLDEEAAIDRNRELDLMATKIDVLASELEAVGRQLGHYSDELDSVYARSRDILLRRLREAVYTTSPGGDDTRLNNIHVAESVDVNVENLLKRSTQKKDPDLQFAPTNLNLHIVRARGQLNTTFESDQTQSPGPTESFFDTETSSNVGSTLMTFRAREESGQTQGSSSGSTITAQTTSECASQLSSLERRPSEKMRRQRAGRIHSAPLRGEYEPVRESTNCSWGTPTETTETATSLGAREGIDDLVHSTVTFGATAAHVKHLGFKDGGLSRLLDRAPAKAPPLKRSLSKQTQHQQTLSAALDVGLPTLEASSLCDAGTAITAEDDNDDRNGTADFAVAHMLLGAPNEQRKARVLRCLSLHLFGGLDAATVPVIEECARGIPRQGRTRSASDQRPSRLELSPPQPASSLQSSGKAVVKSAAISFAARALLASRVDVVISQALALAGAHVEAVIGRANPSILERTVATTSAGPGRLLLGIECLLSTLNDELGMIEDLVVATEWLSTLTCRFIVRRNENEQRKLDEESRLPSSMRRFLPCDDGQLHFRHGRWRVQRSSHGNGTLVADFIIEGEVADMIERLAGNQQLRTGPIDAEDGFRIVATTRIEAVLFSQGINEWQTVANNFGAASLQAEVNAESLRTLSAHVDWAERVVRELALGDADRAATADAEVNRWRQLLSSASDAVRDSSATKNVHVLLKTSDLCRALVGSHCICCKSGKDRTSMAVTLEQTRSLATHLGVFDERHVCKLLRRHGVRRVNIIANTSQDKYAFNTVQVRSLPRCYRPPSGTYSGNTPA